MIHRRETGIIKTGVPEDHEISKGVYDKYSDIYQIELQQNELSCYLSGNRREYRGPVKYKLQFEDNMEDECYPGAFQKEIVINNLYEKLLEEETKGWPIAQNRTLGLRLITKES